MWPKLAAAYIEGRLAPLMPKEDAQLDAFQRRARCAQRLEEAASVLGSVFIVTPCLPLPLLRRTHAAALRASRLYPSALRLGVSI